MIDLAIIVGSTRPGRKADAVASWVHGIAAKREGVRAEVVDIAAYDLPLLDEPSPPSTGKYTKEHTKRWAAKIASFDAFVLVTPEYNHGPSAALKNALDFVYKEWNDKAVGFVGYGAMGATRAVEQLRAICGELSMADVRAAVALTLRADFENFTTFKPQDHQAKSVDAMLDQIVRWGTALKTVR